MRLVEIKALIMITLRTEGTVSMLGRGGRETTVRSQSRKPQSSDIDIGIN